MARIRTVKPEFWTDEKLALLSPLTRLVFLGLLSQADDCGRLVDNVKLLDGLLFPSTDDSCRAALSELSTTGRIVRYLSDSGQPLIQLANWDKHQKVKNPSRYTLPAPSTRNAVESTPIVVESPPYDPLSPIPYPLSPTADPQGTATGGRADLISEMTTDVEAYAERTYPDPVKRKTFVAKARGAIAGEDRTAWEDGSARPAPWEDRPRILRLALDRLAAGESDSIRGALKWVVAQQIDPDRQRPGVVGELKRPAPEGPTNMPADPRPELERLKAEHPEVYADAVRELEGYPWWETTRPDGRADEIRKLIRDKLAARPRIVA